ncbi:MAG: NTP transferase domain-containing protein, partial [Deltaproteobacteria bacterium]|nr:NTP transferase domain-containing protein [Deltaproteobacteria bacterium]
MSTALIKSAMLLAAGFGTRLGKLSQIRPKALFPILNRPILDIWLEKLRNMGVVKVVVNAHHNAQILEEYLLSARETYPELEIIISKEDEILGTGGGIKHAADYFREAFFVINADIFTDFPLSRLVECYESKPGSLGVLACGPFLSGTVSVGRENEILALRAGKVVENELMTLYGLGLMLLSPEVPKALPNGNSDVIFELNKLIKSGGRLFASLLSQLQFTDIGTPRDYFLLNMTLANGGRFVEDGARIDGDVSGFLIAERGAVVKKGARVENCILWRDAYVERDC